MRLNSVLFFSYVVPYPDRGQTGQWVSARKGRSDGIPGLTFCSLLMIHRLLRQGVDLFIVCFDMFDMFKVHFLHQQHTKHWLYIIHPPLTSHGNGTMIKCLTKLKYITSLRHHLCCYLNENMKRNWNGGCFMSAHFRRSSLGSLWM